jgi:hypothetical protein
MKEITEAMGIFGRGCKAPDLPPRRVPEELHGTSSKSGTTKGTALPYTKRFGWFSSQERLRSAFC